MPAEAATNVVNIIQFLYTPQNGSGAYAQHYAHFFGADFIVPLDERDDFCIQIVLSDILTDILRDTVIQVRHNDRKLVSVRSECRALILGVVDLCLVAVQNFPKAAALALHIAQTVEHIGQRSARHPPCRKSARRPTCSQKHLRSCTSFWAFLPQAPLSCRIRLFHRSGSRYPSVPTTFCAKYRCFYYTAWRGQFAIVSCTLRY